MAYSPIALTVPQYHVGGVPASGYVLKAYKAGLSTVLQMATDAAAGTLVNDIVLNSAGYPAVSGNIVIPHINANFKLALYPTQAAADDNTGATWTIDNLTPTGVSADTVQTIANLTDLRNYDGVATTIILEGSAASGDGLGAMYFLTTGASVGTYVDNGDSIIVPTGGDGSSAWLLITLFNGSVSPPDTHNEDYTLVLADAGKTLLKTAADTTTRTWTIPLNSSVVFPVGSLIQLINLDDNAITVTANSTATLRWLNGTAPADGDRTLGQGGVATLYNDASDTWLIWGNGGLA